eukprot:4194637-Pyramimonas_sp.AAC.1
MLSWGVLGRVVGALGVVLGPSWVFLGPSSGHPGAQEAHQKRKSEKPKNLASGGLKGTRNLLGAVLGRLGG